MTSSAGHRSRRLATAASAFALIAVVASVLVLAVGAGVPEPWWPHTGKAFAADAPHADREACALIVGPAKKYCERGTKTTASAEEAGAAGAAWRLGTAGAGAATLVVWRWRSSAGRRRR
ncbi:hypothetical protein [Streptomyces chartreusis]|uniref:hypothetical protein n=1 Tax=Streptomyces chartreusis TaxID=1969 RepID=UPI002E80FCA0|nr:hypothetical protein [Streptomyces chartreusis]WUB23868.1 hypothetical protein OG997_44915 [Streptomyces chartreusis]